MTRRDLMLAAAAGVAGVPGLGAADLLVEPEAVWPEPLKPGDKVGLVTPAGCGPEGDEENKKAAETVRGWGFEPVFGPGVGKRFAYLGGDDKSRGDDINWAFGNKELRGVFPIRGGYGCTRMLGRIDFDLVRSNPKVVLGYSDITALCTALWQETGLVTFHGPLPVSSPTDYSDKWRRLATEGRVGWKFEAPGLFDDAFRHRTVVGGLCSGRLVGGNLTVLAAMCGTRFQLRGSGKVVFLEDVNEAPYRIDRMLTQMVDSGCFSGAVGVLLGQFTKCDLPEPGGWRVSDVAQDIFGRLGVPCLAGCAFGHVADKWTLPVGGVCELDSTEGVVRVVH